MSWLGPPETLARTSSYLTIYGNSTENPSVTIRDEASGGLKSKKCTICQQLQPIHLFHKNQKSRDGLDSRCAPCKADRKRLALYDLEPEQYKQMLFDQEAKCAICGRELPELDEGLVVDHDHATGWVRGLLCKGCNFALGLMNDDVVRLQSAINYLVRSQLEQGIGGPPARKRSRTQG